MSEEATRPAVVVQDLRRAFGGREVLRGVSATLAPGKVVGLLGRNGEGKTTLLRILLDMLDAEGGEVEVLGLRPDGSGAIRQRVGYVPERPSFHEFMTVAEVLELRSGLWRGWKQDKALALARQLELDPSTPIRGASKGTLGKLAWVCAAAHDPELLLLDEPTSGLDALVRRGLLRDLVGQLHDSGRTILVANHRMEELGPVLDEVWVLAGGRIAGVYAVETLRREACTVSGRLKEGARAPEAGPALALPSEGPLLQWAALERPAADRLAASEALEGVRRARIPLESVFELMLSLHAGRSHA